MKKYSLLKNSFAVGVASLSLAFLACGDDSSATGADIAELDSSSSIELSSSDEALSSAAVESSSAKSAVSSSGKVASSSSVKATSSATAPASSATAQKNSSSSVKAVASSSSVAVAQSSSVAVASSASNLPKSSSSVVAAGPSHLLITDAVAQCGARTIEDPLLDGSSPVQTILPKDNDSALPPMAGRYVSTERTGFYIENVTLTCGATIDTLDVYVSSDTVYVNAKLDYTNAQRCLCPSKVDFAVDNAPAYSHARWLVFDDGSSRNLHNTMEIYDISVITVEEVMTEQKTTDIKVECKNDRRTLDKPSLANSTLLPVMDTASTKQIYAVRRDIGEGYETITINELDVGCSVKDVQFIVSAYNDTMFVKPSAGLYATNCICPSRIDFKIKKGLQFTDTHYLVFDKREAMPLLKSN